MGCQCLKTLDKSEIFFKNKKGSKSKKKTKFEDTSNYIKVSEDNDYGRTDSKKAKSPYEAKSTMTVSSNNVTERKTLQSVGKKVLIASKLTISSPRTKNSISKSLRNSETKDFKTNMLDLINEARSNPVEFSTIVKEYKNLIHLDINNKPFIEIKDKSLQRINLIKGEAAFDDLVASLHSILPLSPFNYKNELELSIDTENGSKREKITELLSKQSQDLASEYKSFGFHLDSDVKDPELSVILQLVDDSSFKGLRRNNLLSYNFNCIGISHTDLNNTDKFYVYLVFAKR
jgi:hypothetical protein